MSFGIFKRAVMFLLPAIICTSISHAQDKNIPADLYKAITIPDSLKKDANAVVRYDNEEVIVKAAGKAVVKSHSVITILNEKAQDDAIIDVFYSKYVSANAVEMIIYDADGKVIKKYHKGDLYDRAIGEDASTLITDYRAMGMKHTIASYPVTVEQTTEIALNGYLDLHDWLIQSPETAVQNTRYRVAVNPTIGFRYKNKNTSLAPQKKTENGMDIYTWQAANLKAYKLEDESVEWQIAPKISFATNAFEYGGIPGDISTWQNYGNWQLGVNADVCSLTPAREEEIRQMTASLKTDKETVKFLYEYMQHNMRYVNVVLGMGGLKPSPATFVDQKKYGDCKGLSNYMTALLKAVNIPSYYAYVNAGPNAEPVDVDFPFDRFDHIIVCVPLKGDTTWLECTSSTQPFGKLGTFTENRNALLITPEGGKLVNTPRSTIADNQFKSDVHITLAADGSAKADIKINTTGEYRAMYLDLLHLKLDEQKQALIRVLNMKQPIAFDIQPGDDKDGLNQLKLSMEYDRFFDLAAGDKQFYRPRVFDVWQATLPPLEKRKTDYYFEHPMGKTCVTTIDLPQGFEVETLPTNTSLKFSYGNFSINYSYDAAKNQVITTSTFNLTDFVIPAARYTEMQQYMDDIAKAQNKKLVIRKKA